MLAFFSFIPASILFKSITGRYQPVSYPDGPITARSRFIKKAYWDLGWCIFLCFFFMYNPALCSPQCWKRGLSRRLATRICSGCGCSCSFLALACFSSPFSRFVPLLGLPVDRSFIQIPDLFLDPLYTDTRYNDKNRYRHISL